MGAGQAMTTFLSTYLPMLLTAIGLALMPFEGPCD